MNDQAAQLAQLARAVPPAAALFVLARPEFMQQACYLAAHMKERSSPGRGEGAAPSCPHFSLPPSALCWHGRGREDCSCSNRAREESNESQTESTNFLLFASSENLQVSLLESRVAGWQPSGVAIICPFHILRLALCYVLEGGDEAFCEPSILTCHLLALSN